ncbi:MAG: hypothetical protein GYA20_10070 [Chloroflexi bacterium]|nr:hypothetical protein [Chloroflexota bacterium]
MAEEEQEHLRQKKNSGLLKKVTGLLRKKTGMLPAAQPQPAETKPLSPFTGPLPGEQVQPPIEENLNARGDDGLAQWEGGGERTQAEADRGEFHPSDEQAAHPQEPLPEWTPEEAQTVISAAEARPDAAAAGKVEPVPVEIPAGLDLDAGLIESMLETEAALTDAGDGSLSTAFVNETSEPAPIQAEKLRAELMPEAVPVSDAPQKTTRNLIQRVTGWLNPDAVKPEEMPTEVSDDELSERLLKVQSPEPAAGIPGQHRFSTMTTPLRKRRRRWKNIPRSMTRLSICFCGCHRAPKRKARSPRRKTSTIWPVEACCTGIGWTPKRIFIPKGLWQKITSNMLPNPTRKRWSKHLHA